MLNLPLEPNKVIYCEGVRIDVYIFPISIFREHIEQLSRNLCEDELKRAFRYLTLRKREEFIVSRGVLRYLLSRYTGIPCRNIAFKYNKFLKPKFLSADESNILFNLSHTEDLIAFTFNKHFELGIDVEYLKSLENLKEVAWQVCTEHEYGHFKDKCKAEQESIFYDLWVKKEAALKALGVGLQLDLKTFSAGSVPGVHRLSKIYSLNDELKSLNENYRGALALIDSDAWQMKNIDELLMSLESGISNRALN